MVLVPPPPPALALSQGVAEGNAPLKVLLMLTGSPGHVACPSGMLEPDLNPPAAAARAAIFRSCIEILVREREGGLGTGMGMGKKRQETLRSPKEISLLFFLW